MTDPTELPSPQSFTLVQCTCENCGHKTFGQGISDGPNGEVRAKPPKACKHCGAAFPQETE